MLRRCRGLVALLASCLTVATPYGSAAIGPPVAPDPALADQGSWSAWRSSPTDTSVRLAVTAPATGPATRTLTVSPDVRRQSWRGVGAALTDASVGILQGSAEGTSLLFDPDRADGAHLNLVRMPTTATDFSTTGWTFGWNDATGTLTAPPVAQDNTDFLVGSVLAHRPDLEVVAVPWTAPAGMKESGSLNGGWLRSDSVGPYGRMLAAQADWLEAEGVPLLAMSLGNEPGHSSNYPTMEMTDGQMISLAQQVGPALHADGVELWSVDHNWADRARYDAVDAGAPGMFDAAAFHCYRGLVGQMEGVNPAPIITECTGTDDGFVGTFRWDARNLVVDAIEAGSIGLLMWNLALNELHGPHTGGCERCRGVIDIHSQTGAITRGPEFFTLAHLARAADPGAQVIASEPAAGVPYVAFRNPDGDIGVFGHNDTGAPQVVSLAVGSSGEAVRIPVGVGDLFTLRGRPAAPSVVGGTVTLDSAVPTVGVPFGGATSGWGPAPVALDYQWLADGAVVPGATELSILPTGSMTGQRLSLRVTGRKAGHQPTTVTSAASQPVVVVEQDPVTVVTSPVLMGEPRVGALLEATYGKWSPAGTVVRFQWLRDGEPIPTATANYYVAQAADLRHAIAVRVRGTYPERRATTVALSTPTPIGPGQIDVLDKGRLVGAMRVDRVLRVRDVVTSPEVGRHHQWRCDGRSIRGRAATQGAYRLRPGDAGCRISVVVKHKAVGYTTVTTVLKRRATVRR